MATKYQACAVILIITLPEAFTDELTYPAACEIYCRGKILDVVQKSLLYRDSKTFVDMKMRFAPEKIIENFETLMNDTKGEPSKFMIKRFVREHFSSPGTELEHCELTDWKAEPKFLDGIKDIRLRNWATDLHKIWKALFRKVKIDVRDNPNMYSVVYVPNPVIIPGGRFREYYYWDSYWIILGLLRSEMFQTAKGMLENFIHLVDIYGYVPNGGRIYYLQRSQPPMLIPMVMLYYSFTNDVIFIKNNVDRLEREFTFWMTNRTVEVNEAQLAHYNVEFGTGPRPEAYMTDLTTALTLPSGERESYYFEVKSAAESGWDSSTRWFIKNGSRNGKLVNTKITSIIPVDLNAILCGNAKSLSIFYHLTGNIDKKLKYETIFGSWKQAVADVLWSESDGIWYDYDKLLNTKRQYFYPSNVIPLWSGCYDTALKYVIAEKVVKYLNSLNMSEYTGGIPTSLVNSGQNWDFPFAIPPLQYMIIIGLMNTDVFDAKALAFKLASNWIGSNFRGYTLQKSMFDYYDARFPGKQAGNMDYDVQTGFGWTNGICLELLHIYGQELESEDVNAAKLILPSIVTGGITISILLCIC